MADSELAVRLALLAAAAAGGWFVVLFVVAVATRPRDPEAGPATMELGPEPPAIVNLITSEWRLGREAVPATLLDLAARRILEIDQIEPERFVVRLGREDASRLLPFERQVLDHVRKLASDGVVPGEALTTGPAADSRKWWDRFRKSVSAHARAAGLSRRRWPAGILLLLGVLALGPAILAGAAVGAIPDAEGQSDPVGALLGIGGGTWFVLMIIVFALGNERETAKGLEAASRWLGVREHLEDDEIFCDLPPAAVAVWDRYIAYGAALDVSVGAVRALPLGAESEDEAWSSYGGKWHVVRISYLRLLPPGWGKHPAVVLLSGLLVGGMALAALVLGAPAVIDFKNDLFDRAPSGTDQAVLQGVDLTLAVMIAVVGFFLLRALVMIAFALPDLFSNRVVDGRIVRVRMGKNRPTQIAVDDGVRSRVRAFVVRPGLLSLRRGSDIRMSVSPRLGYIRSVEVVKPALGGADEPAAATAVSDLFAMFGASPGGLMGWALGGLVGRFIKAAQTAHAAQTWQAATITPLTVDDALVSGAVGVPVSRTPGGDGPDPLVALVGMGGSAQRATFTGDGTDEPKVELVRWVEPGAYRRLVPFFQPAVTVGVPGVGDEAAWFARQVLFARAGDTVVAVGVGFWSREEGERREVAARLARGLLTESETPPPTPVP